MAGRFTTALPHVPLTSKVLEIERESASEVGGFLSAPGAFTGPLHSTWSRSFTSSTVNAGLPESEGGGKYAIFTLFRYDVSCPVHLEAASPIT